MAQLLTDINGMGLYYLPEPDKPEEPPPRVTPVTPFETYKDPVSDTMKLLRNTYVPKNRINIVGDSVQLNEDGFVEERDTAITSFKKHYFPASGDEYTDAKIIFSMVFDTNLHKEEHTILPPEDEYQLRLLIQGLNTRKTDLISEMNDLIQKKNDTVLLRTKLQLYRRIDSLMKHLDVHLKNNNTYDYTPSKTPKGVVRPNPVDLKNMENMLRQFAFLTLQASKEVPQYADATDTAHKMVSMIQDHAITKEEMDSYIKLWREQAAMDGSDMPYAIAEVLDRVSGQTGLIESLVGKQLDSQYVELVNGIKQEYADSPNLLNPFNQLVLDLKNEPSITTRMLTLLRWVVMKNKDAWDNLTDIEREAESVRGNYSAKNAELKGTEERLNQAQRSSTDLESQLQEALANHSQTEQDLQKTQDAYERYKKAHETVLKENQQLTFTQAELVKLREQLAATQTRLRSEQAFAASAKAAHDTANKQLTILKNRIKPLGEQNKELTSNLQTLANGTADIHTTLTQKQRQIQAMELEMTRLRNLVQTLSDKAGVRGPMQVQYSPVSDAFAGMQPQRGGARTLDQDKIAELQIQLATLEKDYNEQVAAMQTTVKQLQVALNQYTMCDAQLKNVQTQLETSIRNTSDSTTKSTYETKYMQVQIENLTESLEEAKQSLATKEEALSSAQETVESLQGTLTQFANKSPKKVDTAIMKQKLTESNETLSDFINNMKLLGENIIHNKEYIIPDGIAPQAGTAFKDLYRIVKTRLGVEKPARNVACFLNYFVMFFIKLLFYTNADDRHEAVLNFYRSIMRDIVKDMVEKMPKNTPKEILYTIMEFTFSLLHSSEAVKLTNEDVGLHVIMTTPDSNPTTILSVIHTRFMKENRDAIDKSVGLIKENLFHSASIKLPKIHFNNPIPLNTTNPYLITLSTFPSFTYIPDGFSPNNKWFDIIDTRHGYARQGVNIADDTIAAEISKTMKDSTIDYISMFILFILLSQEYLLLIQDEMKKCI